MDEYIMHVSHAGVYMYMCICLDPVSIQMRFIDRHGAFVLWVDVISEQQSARRPLITQKCPVSTIQTQNGAFCVHVCCVAAEFCTTHSSGATVISPWEKCRCLSAAHF